MIENNRYFWSHLKTSSTTVRVNPKAELTGMVFRVNNIVDLGMGRQTIFLDHIDYPDAHANPRVKRAGAVPMRMGDLDFVYASRKTPVIRNVRNLIASLFKDMRLEKIVVDVISPGDLIVFRQDENTRRMRIVETLRIVKENTYTKTQAEYAL